MLSTYFNDDEDNDDDINERQYVSGLGQGLGLGLGQGLGQGRRGGRVVIVRCALEDLLYGQGR